MFHNHDTCYRCQNNRISIKILERQVRMLQSDLNQVCDYLGIGITPEHEEKVAAEAPKRAVRTRTKKGK